MLRTYLDPAAEYRLNVWDKRFRVPNVSLMHNHPWHFDSKIIAGILRNQRFRMPEHDDLGDLYAYGLIRPGPGGGMIETLGQRKLHGCPSELYGAGRVYRQEAAEIHVSDPHDGTVTINKRERVGDDFAHVYWPASTNWVSAEPREATPEEVMTTTTFSLLKWFQDTV